MQLAEVEELEHKLKELEATCSPIISKMYQGGARPVFGSLSPVQSTLCRELAPALQLRAVVPYLLRVHEDNLLDAVVAGTVAGVTSRAGAV